MAIAPELERRGHEIVWTARDYAQTVELARGAGLRFETFGSHGGKNVLRKGLRFFERYVELWKWSAGREIDLVLSHNSQEPLAVARLRGIPSVNLMDYEHHPMNHMSFRFAKTVVVPDAFPDESLGRLGALGKTKKFKGIKEDVYLADFIPDPGFKEELRDLGVLEGHILVVVRPHAPEALYHRGIVNEVLDALLDKCAADPNVRVILLPRKDYQGEEIRARHPQGNIIIPDRVLNGPNLLAAADLVFSGGGTMNREAAALGIPTATIFAGKGAAVDDYLAEEGRLVKLQSVADLERVSLIKKEGLRPRTAADVRDEVVGLILDSAA
jgi:predicted glycosyltransferase